MTITFTIGDAFTLDESAGLQTTLVPVGDEDNNDDDVALSTLPLDLKNVLTGLGADLSAGSFADTIGVSTSSSDFVQISATEELTDVSLNVTDGTAAGFNVTGGDPIYLYNDPNNPNIVYGIIGDQGSDPLTETELQTLAANGDIAFALFLDVNYIDANTAEGQLWVVELQPLENIDGSDPGDHDGVVLDLDGLLSVSAGEQTTFDFDGAPSGQNLFLAGQSESGNIQLVVTGLDPNPAKLSMGGTVNSSQASKFGDATLGSGSQAVDPGEGLVMTFVKDMDPDFVIPNLSQTEADVEANIAFTGGVVDASGASFVIAQTTPNKSDVSLTLRAFTTEAEPGVGFTDPETGYGDDCQVEIDAVTVLDQNGDPATGITILMDFDGSGGVLIEGLEAGDVVTYSTAIDHNRLEIVNPEEGAQGFDGDSFDIGQFSLISSGTDSETFGVEVRFEDDGPSVTIAGNTVMVIHDESEGVNNDGSPADDDVAGTTDIGGGTIAALFDVVTNTGSDPDVNPDAESNNDAIGYARSGGSLVTITASDSGSDGWAGGGAVTGADSYALSTTDGTFSGLRTTEGVDIFLYNGTGTTEGMILGRVGTEASDTPGDDIENPVGTVAFAIAIDADTGEVFTAQWLSVESSSPGDGTTPAGSHDESDAIADGAVQITITVTDGDEDIATSTADVGDQIKFQDDGPSVTVAGNSVTVIHDETPGVNNDGQPDHADDDDVAGNTLPAAILVLFNGLAGTGNDPDVDDLDNDGASTNNAIGYARSGASLVTITTSNSGSDGWAGGGGVAGADSYALSTTDGTFSGLRTTEGVDIFLYKSGDMIVGRVGTEASDTPGSDAPDDDGLIAFAIAIEADTGEVFTAQWLSVESSSPGDGTSGTYDEGDAITDLAVQVVVTATDGDGDTVVATADVGDQILFQDDGPSLGTIASTVVAFVQSDGASSEAVEPGLEIDGDDKVYFDFDPGADGLGSLKIVDYTGKDGADEFDGTGLDDIAEALGGAVITAALTDNDTKVTYSFDGVAYFELNLDPNDPENYTFEVLQNPPLSFSPFDFSELQAGSPVETISLQAIDSTTVGVFNGVLFGPIDTADGFESRGIYTTTDFPIRNSVDLPGTSGANTSDDLNPNDIGFGVRGGAASNMNNNEGFSLSFFTDSTQTLKKSVEGMQFTIDQQGGTNDVVISFELIKFDSLVGLVDPADEHDIYDDNAGDGNDPDITSIVTGSSVTLLDSKAGAPGSFDFSVDDDGDFWLRLALPTGNNDVIFTILSDEFESTYTPAANEIVIFVDGDYETAVFRMAYPDDGTFDEYPNQVNDSVRIKDIFLIEQDVAPDVQLAFAVEGTDGDGDVTGMESFMVTVDGDGVIV